MKMTRRAFAGLGLGLLSAAVPHAAEAQPRRRPAPSAGRPKAREVADLRRFAEATHPNGAVAVNDPRWRGLADRLQSEADRLTPERYLIGVLRLLAWFRDGHTTASPFTYAQGAFALRLPLQAEAFSDGVYLLGAQEEAAPLTGARIATVAGVPIAQLLARAADFWPGDNPAWLQRFSAALVTSPGILRGMGVLTGPEEAPIAFAGVTLEGRAVRADIRPRPVAELGQFPTHGHAGQNSVRSLNDGRVALINFTQMGDVDGKPFSVFRREIFAAIDEPRTERVIFDVRRNGGGDNFIGDRVRRHVQLSRLNRPGGLYVLIGPQTFSAAQNFVTRMERETFATFIGQPTGGRPNHFGDAVPFVGAHSGLNATVSRLRWQDMPPLDERIWVMPDIPVPELLANHIQQIDPALNAALAHAPALPADERVLLEPWARASQRQIWTPFWAA